MSNITLYIITCFIAGYSILYELIIAQSLSNITSNTIVWYSVTIGIYIGSMGLASLLQRKIVKNGDILIALFEIEILLSIVGALSPILIAFGKELGQSVFFTIAVITISLVGFLTGLELPLLMELGQKYNKKNISNRILGVDYMGALGGSLIFPLFFVTRYNLFATTFLVAIGGTLVSLIIIIHYKKTKKIETALSVVLLLILSLGLIKSSDIDQYFLQEYYYYSEGAISSENKPIIESYKSPYQQIDLVYYEFNDIPRNIINSYLKTPIQKSDNQYVDYSVFINGDYQFSADSEAVYHEYFAHVPIILFDQKPKNVLVLGGGDGLLIKELLKYEEIENITHVDIDPVMVDLAKKHPLFTTLNQNSLKNDKVNTIIDDGFHYIRNTKEIFDAVYLDLPSPTNYDLSRLYSKEFYYLIQKHLSEDGFMVLDTPGSLPIGSTEADNEYCLKKSNIYQYYNTIKASGFETVLPYVAYLEWNNSEAIEYLNTLDVKITDQDKKTTIENFLKKYISSIEEPFILSKKLQEDVQINYHDPKIDFEVLNEQRFKKAFFGQTLNMPIDPDKVNSIVKPTLSHKSIWSTKIPYQLVSKLSDRCILN